MKILLAGLSHKLGGVEKIIYDYVSHMNLDCIEIGVLCEYGSVCFENEFLSLGCKIERVPSRKNVFAYYSGIKKIVMGGV